jgi:predicted amidohydrolase
MSSRFAAAVIQSRDLTADASKQGAKLVVFPEAFVSAYPKGLDFGARVGSRTSKGRDDFRKYFDSAIDVPGRATEELSRAAKESVRPPAPSWGNTASGCRRQWSASIMLGGSISPLGQVLAGPLFNEDAILLAEIDLAEVARGKYDFDVVGHYARPDVFRLHVNEKPAPPVIVD